MGGQRHLISGVQVGLFGQEQLNHWVVALARCVVQGCSLPLQPASSLQKSHAGGLHHVSARATVEPLGMVMIRRVDPGKEMKVGPDTEV